MKKKICVVTGSRSEYGLLRWLMQDIKDDLNLCLQLIVTGSHLAINFGNTYKEIESDGFFINKKIQILNETNEPSDIVKCMASGLKSFPSTIKTLNPDLVIILGDRYEIMPVAISSLILGVPLAHIHGGELTLGSYDDSIRHAITKMANLHFVSTRSYLKRIIQMGEDPNKVFLVGGLGQDNLKRLKLLERQKLEKEISFKFGKKSLLITLHAETISDLTVENQIDILLDALNNFKEVNLLFTMPNADQGNKVISDKIKNFVQRNKNSLAVTSMGQRNYLSAMKYVNGVVGNSSSGIIEAPSLKKGTVNIGKRQKGRVQAKSIINTNFEKKNITDAIEKLFSKSFQNTLTSLINPYGDGGASRKILKTIKTLDYSRLKEKKFNDIQFKY